MFEQLKDDKNISGNLYWIICYLSQFSHLLSFITGDDDDNRLVEMPITSVIAIISYYIINMKTLRTTTQI